LVNRQAVYALISWEWAVEYPTASPSSGTFAREIAMADVVLAARIPSTGLDARSLTLESKQALDRFLAGVERRALLMARMATRNVDEAMDIVQDSMLQLVRHYGGRDEGEWAPLFHRILQRRIVDWHRRARTRNRWRHWFSRDEENDSDPLDNQPDPAAVDPVQAMRTDRAAAALNGAIAALPLRQQQAFLLRAWEGMDTEQTARTMGCSPGSVKTHYSRAVHALRERLKDHEP
jgi:RNA polymerase sigma-70 factor (ECF subfamily)